MKNIYLTIKYGKDKSVKGYILDISRGGISIACRKRISKNAIIEIITEKNILLPMRGKIVSTVCRQRKPYSYRLGVKFISTEKEKKGKLNKFISKIEKRRAVRLKLI